jgi:hypothetical protein
MQIIASSGGSVLSFFAHAGYVSAYPRALEEYTLPSEPADRVIDVAEALRLKVEALGSLVPQSGIVESPGFWAWAASGVVALGMLVLALMALRKVPHLQVMWRRARGSTALLAGVSLFAVTLVTRAWGVGETEPWEKVQLRSYVHPERATWVILHGLVGPALENKSGKVSRLAELRDRIGLPAAKLTEGQAYAVSTYGLDGWGREFRLKVYEKWGRSSYRVTSSGKDGRFGSADDLTFWARQLDDGNWDRSRYRRMLFMRRQGRKAYLLFHRWWGKLFRFKNQRLAEKLTATELFDVWRVSKIRREKVRDLYRQTARRLRRDKLYMLRYRKGV